MTEFQKLENLIDVLRNKSEWYRLPERENVKSPIKKFPIGSFITSKRIIIRAGYYYQPEDMPEVLLEERRLKIVTINTNHYLSLTPEQRKLNDMHAGYISHWLNPDLLEQYSQPLSLEMVGAVLQTILEWGNQATTQLDYEIRGQWLHEQKMTLDESTRELRTFWYVNYEWTWQIRDYKNKQIGTREPGSIRGSYYDSDGDYEPPYLAVRNNQNLYHIGWADFLSRKKYQEVYIHPDDME